MAIVRQHEKARCGRWINVPPDVFAAVDALVPREDRNLGAPIFKGMEQGSLRREMVRAREAAGLPLYSPHDLQHRLISLWHHRGSAGPGSAPGWAKLVTADTYTHVLIDGEEIDRSWAGVPSPSAQLGTH